MSLRRLRLGATTIAIVCLLGAGSACHRQTTADVTPSQTMRLGAPANTTPVVSEPTAVELPSDANDEQESDTSLDDDQDDDSDPNGDRPPQPHPFAEYSDAALQDLYRKDPSAVGSVSVGRPNAGRLVNGVRPSESPLYHLVDPSHAYGTRETVEALCHALRVVAEKHPGTGVVDIGHLSAATGGPLRPHRSHQSGRDVDLGLYYTEPGTRWYTRARHGSLDLPRTWTLIRTLATDTDIEMILLDRRLQSEVEEYALGVETDKTWVRRLFHGDASHLALVRHSEGHATHLHLRFRNPIARETSRRLGPLLEVPHKVATENSHFTYHTASTGDTLAKLAHRYGTTMTAIRAANHMRTYQLVAGHRYIIPTSYAPKSPGPHAGGRGQRKPKR